MKPLFLLMIIYLTLSSASGQHYLLNGIDSGEKVPEGLEVGNRAPDFTGINQHGDTINLYHELTDGKVVLIFYRGFWCGACNRYLKQYQDSLGLITKAGAKIIAVTPEQAEGVGKTIGTTHVTFDIVSDSANRIMQKYRVDFKVTGSYTTLTKIFRGVSIAENNKQEDAWLPIPATYIINRKGIIEYVQFDPDYQNRASVKEIMQHL